MCFDAVAAFGQAPETELIFIDALEEHRAVVGQHVLWQCLKVREGRRKGARAWQDHFIETLVSQDCPGSSKQSLKSPTIFYSSDFEAALDLHVDDGYMTGPAEMMMQVFAYLEGAIVSPIIGVGDSFEHVGALRVIDKRRNVGEGTGQVRDLCVDDDAKGLSSIDESQARETDRTWRR